MSKKEFGPQTWLYVEPTVLVGANVDGKPNFATVAWTGIAGGDPPSLSVALRHTRYTLKGIQQNLTFSVNIPSSAMVTETDYCGIVSGANADKVKDCGFKVFYGNLDTAPLVEQCPVNLECEVAHSIDVGSHTLVIGRIVQTHVSEDCLTDGKPDISKIQPVIYSPRPAMGYYTVGQRLAEPFKIGKEIKRQII